MTLLFPKPVKSDRPSLKRKRLIKKLDRRLQSKARTCIVPGCGRKPGRHHRIKRRYLEYRHDERFVIDLCWIPHHQEIERIGEEAFCEKYGLHLPELPERFKPRPS